MRGIGPTRGFDIPGLSAVRWTAHPQLATQPILIGAALKLRASEKTLIASV